MSEWLMHYGTPKHSGRYPWGSGKDPYQHSADFLGRVDELKKMGMKQTEIAETIGLNTTQLRTQIGLAKNEQRNDMHAQVRQLQAEGYSISAIGRQLGKNESSIRSLLNEDSEARMKEASHATDHLRDRVNEVGMIQIGAGVERELGISKEKLNQALYTLELEGYKVFTGAVPQVTNPGQQTIIKVLGPPTMEQRDTYDYANINSVFDYRSHDGGDTFKPKFVYPKSLDSSRVGIKYAEEGGVQKDGVVEIRRGVDDISLGESRYSQVRILVDGTHYIKGMAVYSDNLPDGVDVLFNTNKKLGTDKMDVLKPISNDPDNPFGSLIKEDGGQSYYKDKDGNDQLSVINKRADEGDWGKWTDKLPSQFLSKQNKQLIDQQLNLTAAEKLAELDEILSLTNPTVKRALLKDFADDADASSVHLKAASLPRQKHQVILPLTTLKDTEVFAPNYANGEKLALVRFPHGGTFEIPIVTVNNKNKEGLDVIGNTAKDAVGITSKVAERLSGADFDGDTVMVIPITDRVNITSTPPLKGLEGFDAKMEYGYKEGMTLMRKTDANGKVISDLTQREMGSISNLITDMTIKGASDDELARAVKHSMVVIDAGKHKLNYKLSEKENDIPSLRNKYQGYVLEDGSYKKGGASTLISRAKNEQSVARYKGNPNIDPVTGRLSYTEAFTPNQKPKTPDLILNYKTGEYTQRTRKSTQMEEVDDAYKLSSGQPQEEAYAKYANTMKDMANTARREMVNTPAIVKNPVAAKTYKQEVDSINNKLDIALRNAPKERQAQLVAASTVNAKKLSNPDMTKSELKKEKQRALTQARQSLGAERKPLTVTDKEWEAIQSGAISENQLSKIIANFDKDQLRSLATPKATTTLSDAKINKIKHLQLSGYTNSEIAESLGVSTSTVNNYLTQ